MSTATIVTRTQNRPVLLARAMDSVLGQTHHDWEHVIVNDGGDAAAVEALVEARAEAYAGRCQVLHNPAATGMQAAANQGIAAGQGTYLCIHDDDDTWAPDFLAEAIRFLEREGPTSRYQGVIAPSLLVEESIGADGTITEHERRPYIPLSEISLFRAGFENPFPPIAFCYRRAAYAEVGPYDPRFNVAGDYDFNFRFLRQFEIGVLDAPKAYYHLRRDPANPADGNSVKLAAREHKQRYNELKNHYLREASDDREAALALAFNASRYLVEIEWVAHETRSRAVSLEQALADARGALQADLRQSVEALNTALAPAETSQYRRELLERIDTLQRDSEKHAEDLWHDLNARTREATHAIEDLTRALAHQTERLPGLIQESLHDVGRESSLLEISERIDQLDRSATIDQIRERSEAIHADLNKAAENLWTDLNQRGRESVAAIEESSKQQLAILNGLHELARETTSLIDRPGRDAAFAALQETLEQLGSSQATALETLDAALRARDEEANARLDRLEAQLERLHAHFEKLQTSQEAERASQRSLFGLGALRLIWKRRPAHPPASEPSSEGDA